MFAWRELDRTHQLGKKNSEREGSGSPSGLCRLRYSNVTISLMFFVLPVAFFLWGNANFGQRVTFRSSVIAKKFMAMSLVYFWNETSRCVWQYTCPHKSLLCLFWKRAFHIIRPQGFQCSCKEKNGVVSRFHAHIAPWLGLESFCCFECFLTISRIICSSCYWPGFFNWAGACNLTAWLQCTAKALHWYVLHCRVAL